MEKKKVAVLDIQPIIPAVGGGRIRLLGLYSGMKSDMDLTYVGSYDWRGEKYRELQISDNLLEIDVPLSDEHFDSHDRLSAVIGKSCIDSAFPLQGRLSAELIDKAKAVAAEADIVVFSHPWLFPFVAPCLDDERQLIVYDSQNCEGLLKECLLDDGTEEAERVSRAVIQSEWELCHAADLILACSEEDKNSFVRLYGVMPDLIRIVPNGVFSNKIRPADGTERQAARERAHIDRPAACFLGSGYEPNVEAAKLILQTAKLLPDILFCILGGVGGMLKDFDQNEHPNVRVTGFLEENEKLDYLHGCDIAINPMLSGSGTNIKMFDFMAAALPVVTTEIGARGINNTNGLCYRLCEAAPEALAVELERVLSDNELRQALAAGGRAEAEGHYSWEKISPMLGELLKLMHRQKLAASKRALMISTYPPENCGIGAYACQQTAWLRENGYKVDVLAIRGNGNIGLRLDSPENLLELNKLRDKYDKIVIQYHASFFYSGLDRKGRIEMHKAFENVLSNNDRIEIVCHEIKFPTEGIREPSAELREENEYKLRKWRAASHVLFHTEIERKNFCRCTGIDINSDRLELVAPNKYYRKARDITPAQARNELGIPETQKLYLCIGFIQPHKAFDKVAQSFARLGESGDKQLYIVGSLRLVNDETRAYLSLLQKYADENDNIHLISSYISDEMFDTWLIAADTVVLPYKEIWSSGVLGRAKLFGKRCIIHDVGGLREQMEEGDILFASFNELDKIIAN